MLFSERNKIIPSKEIMIDGITKSCRNRLINTITIFFKNDLDADALKDLYLFAYDKFGKKIDYEVIAELPDYLEEDLITTINEDWDDFSWNTCFDFVEIILKFDYKAHEYYQEALKELKIKVNCILSDEKIGYRIINNQIINITNEEEIHELETAMDSIFTSVDNHIEKALKFFSDRKNPDYKNSIKESITAVESMCCIICGKNVELGKALGKLEKNGIYIHGAMRSSFQSLYGYTSDESGIRHGGFEDKEVTEEDARFMLVTCSAFINYLKIKYEKIGGNENG